MIQRTDNTPQYRISGSNGYCLSKSLNNNNCCSNLMNEEERNNIWSQEVNDGNGLVALTQSPQSTNLFIKCAR